MFVPTCVGSGLRAQTCSCACSLYSCIHGIILAHVCLLFSSYARRFHSVHAALFLHTCGARQKPQFGHLDSFIICSSSVCNLNIIPHHFCIPLYAPHHISLYCEYNITFSLFFSPNHEFDLILFLQVLPPYSGKRSTNRYWYGTASLLKRLEVTFILQALSLSSACCLKGLLVLSWRKP